MEEGAVKAVKKGGCTNSHEKRNELLWRIPRQATARLQCEG